MQHLNIFVLFDGLQKGMLSMEREFFFVSSCYPSTSLVFVPNYWLCVFLC